MGNTLFFTATDGESGFELWRSDGTADGTKMVKNIYPDPSPRSQRGSNPRHMVAMNGWLYFSADDGTNGRKIWKSNGTEAGTTRVKNVGPGPGPGSPTDRTVMNNAVYFVAGTSSTNRELWKTDGKTTSLIKDIHPTWGSFPKEFAAIGGKLYFQASDGTTAGTVDLGGVVPGLGVAYKKGLVFSANGRGPWCSDGSKPGTAQIARNLTDCVDGFVRDKRFLILDNDSLFTAQFVRTLKDAGVAPVRTAYRAPDMNAIAERWVLSVKSECLNRMILFGERWLLNALHQYCEHYNLDRPHQSLRNEPLTEDMTVVSPTGGVVESVRLGGMLRSYRRAA